MHNFERDEKKRPFHLKIRGGNSQALESFYKILTYLDVR